MSKNYVDKMDDEPVGIKRLVDCHTGKYAQSLAITEWGLGCAMDSMLTKNGSEASSVKKCTCQVI